MRCITLTSIMAAGLAAACVPSASGAFGAGRFQSSQYPYDIVYQGSGPDEIVSKDWRIDNFRSTGAALVAKTTDPYWVERAYDVNDDGVPEYKEREPFYEILLEHRELDAALWVRTVPMSNHDRQKALRVFAERYVESAAGSGHIAVHFGAEVTVSIEKRFASRVVGEVDCEVAGRPTRVVDFEVANVDQLQLSDSARWSRGRVAFIRTNYEHPVGLGGTEGGKYPVLMIVGLSANPTEFDKLAPDFDSLLGRIAMGSERDDDDRINAKPGHTCKWTNQGSANAVATEATSGAEAEVVPASPSEPASVPAEGPATPSIQP